MPFKKFGQGEVVGQQDARRNDQTIRELASAEKAKKAEFQRIYGVPEEDQQAPDDES